MQKKIQCKDIPTLPILKFLDTHGTNAMRWCNWHCGEDDVHKAMPDGTPDKIVLAKMRALIRDGVVSGCPCGCRGDFTLTDKGRALLAG